MRPLEGIKVVDLTTYLAAPTTVRVLGEWGADCVKIGIIELKRSEGS